MNLFLPYEIEVSRPARSGHLSKLVVGESMYIDKTRTSNPGRDERILLVETRSHWDGWYLVLPNVALFPLFRRAY